MNQLANRLLEVTWTFVAMLLAVATELERGRERDWKERGTDDKSGNVRDETAEKRP